MHDEYVNLEGLKGVFTKDTKGLMGCKFEGGTKELLRNLIYSFVFIYADFSDYGLE